MTDSSSLMHLIQKVQPDEIYNLAAQSHVAVSFEEPEYGKFRCIRSLKNTGGY